MSTSTSPKVILLVEWIGKKKKRAVGSQVWYTPVRKDRNKPLMQNGQVHPENLILDCSVPGNRLEFNGSTVQITEHDSTERLEAIKQLAGLGTPNGDLWGILKEGDSRQLYRVVEVAEQERKKLEEVEERVKYQTRVMSMKDEELREYALLLGVQGSLGLIKVTLGSTYFEKGNESLKKQLLHYLEMDDEERMMQVALIAASKVGKPDLKQGVHQRLTGLYYNDRRLGVDVQDAVINIINAEDRVELMTAIKGFTVASENKTEKPKKAK